MHKSPPFVQRLMSPFYILCLFFCSVHRLNSNFSTTRCNCFVMWWLAFVVKSFMQSLTQTTWDVSEWKRKRKPVAYRGHWIRGRKKRLQAIKWSNALKICTTRAWTSFDNYRCFNPTATCRLKTIQCNTTRKCIE